MQTPSFRIGEALSFGWRTFKVHAFFLWAALGVIFGNLLFFDWAAREAGLYSAVGILLALFGLILKFIFELGLIRLLLDLHAGQKDRLTVLLSQATRVWRYVGASLVYTLFVVGGLLLLVVPGIYALIRLQFFSYIIVEENVGPIEALKKSAAITQGHVGALFLFLLMAFGLLVVSALPFGLGLLVSVPVSMLASVFVYRALLNASLKTVLRAENDSLAKETA